MTVERSIATSEIELQRELDLPRTRSCAGDNPRGRTNAGSRQNYWVRFRKDRAIQNVEGFRPKLQIPPLVDSELLEHRGVQREQAGPNIRPSRHIPPCARNRKLEGLGIEP